MLTAGSNVEWLRDDLGLIEHGGAVARRRVAVRGHRGRRVRPRAPRPRHTGLGLRRPLLVLRAHPRLDSCSPRAGSARGSRTPRHRSRRGRRDRHGPRDRPPQGRRRHVRQPDVPRRAGQRQHSGRSRSRRWSRPPPSAPRSSPASPSARGRAWMTSPRPGDRVPSSSRSGKLDRARWLDARTRAEGWVAELSSLDF